MAEREPTNLAQLISGPSPRSTVHTCAPVLSTRPVWAQLSPGTV